MNARAEFCHTVVYIAVCAHCRKEHTVQYFVAYRNLAPDLSLPFDWTVVDGMPVCTDHIVTVQDRPKPETEQKPDLLELRRDALLVKADDPICAHPGCGHPQSKHVVEEDTRYCVGSTVAGWCCRCDEFHESWPT